MTWSLYDGHGQRKYLNSAERAAFIRAAMDTDASTASFCLTLALTGARISEILELTGERIDVSNSAIILETLKRRRKGIFRAVPVPAQFVKYLMEVHGLSLGEDTNASHERLWKFSRPTAWKRTKAIMRTAQVPAAIAKPKALRHAFGVEAVRNRIALSLVRKWLGHTKIETTAIYAEPIGDEERALAQLMWRRLPIRFTQPTTAADST
jgi:integrase